MSMDKRNIRYMFIHDRYDIPEHIIDKQTRKKLTIDDLDKDQLKAVCRALNDWELFKRARKIQNYKEEREPVEKRK